MSLPQSSIDLTRSPYFVDFSEHVVASSANLRTDSAPLIPTREESNLYDVYDIFSSSNSVNRGAYTESSDHIALPQEDESPGDRGEDTLSYEARQRLTGSSSLFLSSAVGGGEGSREQRVLSPPHTAAGRKESEVSRRAKYVERLVGLVAREDHERDRITWMYIRACIKVALPIPATVHPAQAMACDFLVYIEAKERVQWVELEQRDYQREIIAPHALVQRLCTHRAAATAEEQRAITLVRRCLTRWSWRCRGHRQLREQRLVRYVLLPEEENRSYMVSRSEEATALYALYRQYCVWTEGVRRNALEQLALLAAVSYAWIHTNFLQQAKRKCLLYGSLAPTRMRGNTHDWTAGGGGAHQDGRPERKQKREVKIKDYTLFHLLVLMERDRRRALWETEMNAFLVVSTTISKSFYI